MNWRALALSLIATLLLEAAALAAPYTVQPGDTLYSLAKRFATTPAALQAVNKLSSTALRVRQVLEIPERVHTVTKGETLYAIARLYKVQIAQLRNLNSMNTDAVQIGQKLTIPWNASDLEPQGPNAVPPPPVRPGPFLPLSPPLTPPLPPSRPPPIDRPTSSPVQMPTSSPVPPPSLPTTAPIVIPSAALQIAPDFNALPPLPSAGLIAIFPERPAPSLPNTPQAARGIPPLVMPSTAALPSISDEPDPNVSSRADAPVLIHTVQSGDTLFNIARRYNISVADIKTDNILESDNLALGQRLRIPATLETASVPQRSNLRDIASRYLGVTYVYGGSSAGGLDCSGFVTIVYRELGVTLPRTSREQFTAGISVRPTDLESGDLVFFDTLGRGAVSHVGIYLGAGEFIHAASNPGKVITSRLEEKYYATRYLGARRVLPQD